MTKSTSNSQCCFKHLVWNCTECIPNMSAAVGSIPKQTGQVAGSVSSYNGQLPAPVASATTTSNSKQQTPSTSSGAPLHTPALKLDSATQAGSSTKPSTATKSPHTLVASPSVSTNSGTSSSLSSRIQSNSANVYPTNPTLPSSSLVASTTGNGISSYPFTSYGTSPFINTVNPSSSGGYNNYGNVGGSFGTSSSGVNPFGTSSSGANFLFGTSLVSNPTSLGSVPPSNASLGSASQFPVASSFWNSSSNGMNASYGFSTTPSSSLTTSTLGPAYNGFNFPSSFPTNNTNASGSSFTFASTPVVPTAVSNATGQPSVAFSINGVTVPTGTFTMFPNNQPGSSGNTGSVPGIHPVLIKRPRGRPKGSVKNQSATKAPKRKIPKAYMPIKKVKDTIIDDEVALQIFRDLKMTDTFLNSGKVLAWALQPDDEAFINIHDYVARSQEHGFGVKILTILRIIPKAADNVPLDFNEDPKAQGMFRMMLWHGTKTPYIGPILENGLKIPTGHGQMFGTGIYFADRVSKSAQYCDGGYGARTGRTAYLFLCDVLLGEIYKATNALPNTKKAPTVHGWGQGPVEYNSIKGCGINVPDIEWQKEIDGCVWPLGPTVRNTEDSGNLTLNYNEYIVYNTEQVQPKYLVKVIFQQNPVYENLY